MIVNLYPGVLDDHDSAKDLTIKLDIARRWDKPVYVLRDRRFECDDGFLDGVRVMGTKWYQNGDERAAKNRLVNLMEDHHEQGLLDKKNLN